MRLNLCVRAAFGLVFACGVGTGCGVVAAETPSATFKFAVHNSDAIPTEKVRVEIVEALSAEKTWSFDEMPVAHLFDTDYFAMKTMPRKYDEKGLIAGRESPLLLHLSCRLILPSGEHEFLLRSVDAARLYIDGKLLVEVPVNNRGAGAHSPYYEGLDRGPGILSLAEGHTEKTAIVKLSEGEHTISLYRLFISKKVSQHLGELIVARRAVGGNYQILGPRRSLPYTDGGWLDFLAWERQHLTEVNRKIRQIAAQSEDDYWHRRHVYARQIVKPQVVVPAVSNNAEIGNAIDCYIQARLEEEGVSPTPIVDDLSFLRRVSLDTIGVIPSPELISEFLSLPTDTRRLRIIDRLLTDPQYADHWVPYWQDVLAENPGLTKPELNNTGPFRWYLHEAFVDNKPFDRFVTELVMMNGDRYNGGPAGFGIASQNDVPMAAKAHILGTAFLGVEMKCARCHDAPYHDVKQKDLFSMAAMLKRGNQQVPKSSSIPGSPEELEQMTVKVTLAPGSSVRPDWPFVDLIGVDEATKQMNLPKWFVRETKDSRERLAAILTSPTNQRFADVIVNRLWKRYLGRGFVEPVDDWENHEPSHPELVQYLSQELITHDYDLKHVIRLIVNSRVYQRQVPGSEQAVSELAGLYVGPTRRRMTAEQLTDSIYAAAGKAFESEELTMDLDGRLSNGSFGHFGIPNRSWEMVSVSNERDRPSLNLPAAQTIVDLLIAFGWRQQRQEPLTDRDTTLTPLQPLALANGAAANRAIDISDWSEVCELCLEEQSVDRFIDRLFSRVLTRTPTVEERDAIRNVLEPRYSMRVVAGHPAIPERRIARTGVCWTSHFDARSDIAITNRQIEVLQGDLPAKRLDPDWRERAEDVLWSLVNSPEFVFIP